jgi:hypothetical protein
MRVCCVLSLAQEQMDRPVIYDFLPEAELQAIASIMEVDVTDINSNGGAHCTFP